ncbi:MAG: hypothetical protein ACE5MM_02485 [Nitrospiraceae bacterium]
MTPVGIDQDRAGMGWPGWLAEAVRLIIAPLVLFFGGFFSADFLLSGLYTWPRTSRVLILTLTVCLLAYEFVYKEQRARNPHASHDRALKALLYSCLLPYLTGVLMLLALARLSVGVEVGPASSG